MQGKDRKFGLSGGAVFGVAAAVAGAFLLGRYLRRADEGEGITPAAVAQPGAVKGSFDQTRDAGPGSMRDEGDDDIWDCVDEGSDESFPASDPPAHNRFD